MTKNNKKYKVLSETGQNDTLVINFTGIGGLRYTRKLSPEFKNSIAPLQCHTGYIIDMTRTWYNVPEVFEGIKESIIELKNQFSPKKTVLMGLSMGGFGAILFSHYVRVDTVIAFSPQIEIDPRLTLHWDKRYLKFLKNITDFINPHVKDCFEKDTEYHVIVGQNLLDNKHLSCVPNRNNIHKLVLPTDLHAPPKFWKKEGILTERLRDLVRPI